MVLDAGAETLIRHNRAVMARPDARAHLGQIPCPTLVLCGEADQLTPPEHSRAIAAAIPGARLALVPGAGHMLTMEQPQTASTPCCGSGWRPCRPARRPAGRVRALPDASSTLFSSFIGLIPSWNGPVLL
jgi:dienelactone hydrolase